MQTLEEVLIDAFIVPAKRGRYKGQLLRLKRREKLLDGLNHCSDFDPRYATEVPANVDVVRLLRSRGAPNSCHVISDVTELDGREMGLKEAIDEIEMQMRGALVGCVPGRLAYYYGEAGEQRLLLERTRDKPMQADRPSAGP